MTNNTSLKDIRVWVAAHRVVLKVYKITEAFPTSETYGLTSQLRRSITSIPTNISEGFYRNGTKELIQFLFIARGSLGESTYQLLLAKDLKYISEADYEKIIIELETIHKQLNAWIRSLKLKI